MITGDNRRRTQTDDGSSSSSSSSRHSTNESMSNEFPYLTLHASFVKKRMQCKRHNPGQACYLYEQAFRWPPYEHANSGPYSEIKSILIPNTEIKSRQEYRSTRHATPFETITSCASLRVSQHISC